MVNAQYEEKLQLFKDAMLWNKPKRAIMYPAIMSGWIALDAGYTTMEIARDYDKALYAQELLYQKYPNLDMTCSPWRFYVNHMSAMGGTENGYGVNNENANENHINVSYEDVLNIEDYDGLKEDEMKVVWEKVIFNMYPKAKDFTPEQFAEAVKEELRLREAQKKSLDLDEKYGLLYAKTAPLFSADCYVGMLFNQYRGIKGLSMDLRRHSEKVYELCEYMDDKSYQEKKALMDKVEPGMCVGHGCYYDVFLSSLAHTILNPKQVERLIINPWRKQIDLCVEKEKTCLGTVEGDWAFRAGIGEFLNEYPKGTMIVEVETDDPFEIRKKLPNIGIMGGLNAEVLGQGTPQQCVDMAKKAIDELGTDGGLLLSSNKMIAYKHDLTPENLKAVTDFVSCYEIN